jgi:pimeloyl-ACP methyl ester carboxylesterase
MIAAEMACLARRDLSHLVLIDAFGLWDDDLAIPDIFAMTPFEMPSALFADASAGEALLTAGLDFGSDEALTDFMVSSARQLGTAGKIMFPIPNRRVAKRLYRLTAPTLVLWGAQDALTAPGYAELWGRQIPHAEVELIEGAGHMLPYEQPTAASDAIRSFLSLDSDHRGP